MTGYSGKDIKVLKDLEPVRLRPGMYIGSVGKDGLHHLIWEILDNSLDEFLAGFADTIKITMDLKENRVTIRDNGRGIPIDKIPEEKKSALRVILSTLHAGGKFNNNNYHFAGGLHGVGSSVVNALSKSFEARVYKDGQIYQDTYAFGKPLTTLSQGEIKPIGKCPKSEKGTEISFIPDDTIFPEVSFEIDRVKGRLKELSYLNKGLTLILNLTNLENHEDEEYIYKSDEGLKGLIESDINLEISEGTSEITDLLEIPVLSNPDDPNENLFIQIYLQYLDEEDEKIKSYVNNIATLEAGTHEQEFKASLTRLLNQYAKDLNINKSKKNYSGDLIRSGLRAVINVKMAHPSFVGQTKSKLETPNERGNFNVLISRQLEFFFDRNRDSLIEILNHIREVESLKKKNTNLKKTKIKKLLAEANGKLAVATSKRPQEKELFLVEGDSAGGSAKMARDRKTQAILPLRGKVLNVEKTGLDRALKNQEIATIIQVLGAGYKEHFNINDLKYHKIIIMTDADVDGDHIRSLLITLFINFFPEIIEKGHLYAALPPLYKAGDKYLYNDKELEEYLKKNKVSHVSRFKGLGEMNPEQLKATTMDIKTRKLKQITVEDLAEAKKITEDLMGKDSALRRDLLFS
ncbi:DNA gyrase/topoisomerase IV subunit B [Peptoniphilus porci]|uniref:DNA topoisomerase (ATP-hydrolyzing) n=1 Tax=Peptoniphilus porci TaxID=2652280 RepID=A0A1U7LXE2_9FIRM|nr:DNA topoisomerase IV subunit B [Peptoniphilus porci]OLR61667.1 hypothetical protein BIV18_09955 [Peptoniphilus porci]